MAATSQFASRYKRDLSTEALRAKVARRRSTLQKENRHKQFEKGRQFGLADLNVQPSKEKGISELKETRETCSQESSSVKQKQPGSAASRRMNERREMLQRYKEQKELRKLVEQREKAKKGVFKVGLYKPAAPGFLALAPEDPAVAKPKEKAAPAFSGRMTRSKAKIQEGKSLIPTLIPTAPKSSTVSAHGQSVRPAQAGRKQMGTAKGAEKEKVLQAAPQPASNVRITRAAASAARQVLKPTATAATAGNQSQRKTTNVGKQKQAVRPDTTKVIPSKRQVEKNAQVDPGVKGPAADSKHSTPVELEQEQTSVENNNFAPGRPKTCSFAPGNFVFQPPSELANYKVKPMTPSSAKAFLTPTAFWNFSKSPVKKNEKSSETKAQKPNLRSRILPSVKGIHEQQMTTSLEGEEAGESGEKTSTQRSNETTPVSTALEGKSDDTGEQEHDVPYFRNILRIQTERLLSQCLQWDGNLELDIPEDAKDLIHTTIGQTRLLIEERFKQFEGLVDNCEFKQGEKETKCTDLDGFWDMINFQIEDVNKKFDNLKKLQDNEWQPLDVPSQAVVKKKAVPVGVPKAKLEAAARAAARSRLASVKAAMREKMKCEGAADGAHQEMLPQAEKVVFEAGFFRVESPVKNFSGLLLKTPHRSSQRTPGKQTTPRSSRRTLLPNTPSALRDPEDATAKQTPQNLKMDQFPTAKTPPLDKLPNGVLEQSISMVAEEEICPVASRAEGNEVLENSSSESKAMDGMEEMELSAAEQGQDVAMCSPEKDPGTETNFAQSGEPKIHQTDVSCSDLTSSDRNPLDMPMLDAELPFTPVKTKAQKFAAAEVFSDLIVFSPVVPSGDK
ncbi:disks large-associated protein 5 isoform X1 [Chiroxiphia lanceolata]|uniref:disks large-associated protein 5 isoform X1 n=1 Tax=Chiroxiphia lanceolata TaxID=296741 RepID=UPI0013CECE11|nr:disks large-associated protein 5 isoform X1 [Chiroxiphia lanceolata]